MVARTNSINIIEEDKIDWNYISKHSKHSKHQKLSKNFIRKFQNKVN